MEQAADGDPLKDFLDDDEIHRCAATLSRIHRGILR